MMLWEALAALLLGGAALWLVLAPLVRPERVRQLALEPEDPLETRRGQSLAALKELDFDREMGKLSDADYESLRRTYTAEALAALRDEAGEAAGTPVAGADAGARAADAGESDAAEALIAARARRLTGASACARCGTRPEADARFCSQCGTALGSAACRQCGAGLRPDGRFCDRCGTAAAA
jgi:hypothetical protein